MTEEDDEYRYKVTARWYGFTRPLGPLLLEAAPPLPTGASMQERLERMAARQKDWLDQRSDPLRRHAAYRREYHGQWFFVGEENAKEANLHGDRPGDVPAHPEGARDGDGEGCGDAQVESEADADKATD